MDHTKLIVTVTAFVLTFLAGMATMHRINTPSVAEMLEASKPKAGAVLADGAVVAPRDGVTPTAKPKHKTPTGTTVERVSGVVVQPDAVVCSDGERVECPAVKIDVTTVALDDGSKQLVFWSDGKIVDSYDTPVVYLRDKAKPWRAYALGVDAGDGLQPGAALARDIGPFSVTVLGAQGFAAAGFGLAF